MSDQVLISLFTTVGVMFAAFMTFLGIRARVRSARAEPVEDEEERIAVGKAQIAADPDGWADRVLRSNEQLIKRVEAAENRAAAAEKRADEVQSAFDAFKREDRQRQGALARWLGRIMAAWGVDHDMPYPEGRDAEILADIIPFALEATQPRRPRRNAT
jgi:hypothetical protein